MAEQNWSKEPWYHHQDPCNISGQDHAKRIIGSLGFIGYVDDYATAQANALRIVACVNACAGIPTEALEAGVIGELVEALKCIKAECGAVCQDFDLCDDPACASSYGAWEIANQALAKLEQQEESR